MLSFLKCLIGHQLLAMVILHPVKKRRLLNRRSFVFIMAIKSLITGSLFLVSLEF